MLTTWPLSSEYCSLVQSLWGDWEMYKVLLETSRQPELMLIVDKWEQLKYVSTAYFKK